MTATSTLARPAETARYADLLAERFSCRGYLPDPVPQETLVSILHMAQRTASWCNSQPWKVVITRGAATERFRQALFDHASSEPAPDTDFPWPREYLGDYNERRRVCGFQLYDAVGIARGDRAASARQAAENYRLFDAPHVAIVTSDEALGVYGAVDTGAFVSNFMLAARAHGVASIAQAAIARYSGFVRSYFGIGDDRRMVCAISFGFEDKSHPANGFRTERAAIQDVAAFMED